MLEVLTDLLVTLVGGGLGNLIEFAIILAMGVGAVFAVRRLPGNATFDKVVSMATIAVEAIEKLSDTGQYADLTREERHAAKKQDAMTFMKDAMAAEGVRLTPALSAVMSLTIEAVLRMGERGQEVTPEAVEEELDQAE